LLVVIKLLYVVLVLSIAALVAVAFAVYFRVRRHLEVEPPETETPIRADASTRDDEAAP
jgi:hypothetical protein